MARRRRSAGKPAPAPETAGGAPAPAPSPSAETTRRRAQARPTSDGRTLPVQYDWYSSSLSDVRGVHTWAGADRAYRRLASNLAAGRYTR